jgi:hypothetical protein
MAASPVRNASAARAQRAQRLFLLLAPILGAIGFSCSETQQPLELRDAVRGGLEQPSPITSVAAVDMAAYDSVAVTNGAATRWLVGNIDRQGTTYSARTFLRWNLGTVPEGTIHSASLSLMISSVELADAAESGPFEIRLYRVTGAWSEDSLVYQPLPSVDVGTPIADALIDTTGLAASGGILLRARLFEDDPDLIELLSDWLADSTRNHGLMLRASSASPSGILRCFSRTGHHPATEDTLATPLLEVTVYGEDTTTVSLEVAADAYTMGPLAPPAPLPDSLLWLSSGVVQRTALHIDPTPFYAEPTLSGSSQLVPLRGVLRLHLAPGYDWSLAGGSTLTIWAYDAEIDWTAADPIPGATLIESLGEVTVAGEDSTVDIPIADHLRRRMEGIERSVLLICAPEVGQAGSVLFKGRAARVGPPEVRAAFGTVDGRWER